MAVQRGSWELNTTRFGQSSQYRKPVFSESRVVRMLLANLKRSPAFGALNLHKVLIL
jgi:hypothetical protein